jgi:hypothetical protein
MHLLKTVGDFVNNLLSLAEGVRGSVEDGSSPQAASLDAIIVLYLKLSCLTRFRRFSLNANKISRIRDSLSRQAREQQEQQHLAQHRGAHGGRFGNSSDPSGGLLRSSAKDDATRNSYVDFMVSEVKDPIAALRAYDRSETLRARGLALGAAAPGGKSSWLYQCMQAIPRLPSYAAPDVVEECIAQVRHALDVIKGGSVD